MKLVSRPMDYYRILNFQKEPFSNSPDPEFFFQSSQHYGCLQRLEIAVRLRRGLSVVIGNVGTGKTTLCRQVIMRFATSEEDKDKIIPFLILDPSFNSALEFLSNVCLMFGLSLETENPSEWQYKEMIKHYLYDKGVNEGKIVLLIIDEGQKLPQFCLEILREFLNYETNEYKLLQIIIFAQNEFKHTLNEMANFADRVNELYLLEPLNFKETRELVKFRLKMASGENREVSPFTFLGFWAIYKCTGGYPRKIVHLCYKAMLTLIIQNKCKAGWYLIRSCVLRGIAEKSYRLRLRWTIPVAVVLIVAISIFAGSSSIKVNLWKNTPPPLSPPSGLPPQVGEEFGRNIYAALPQGEGKLDEQSPGEGVSMQNADSMAHPHPASPLQGEVSNSIPPALTGGGQGEGGQGGTSQEKKFPLLGQLTVTKKETVWAMINRFYGGHYTNLRRLEAVIRANPQIKDFDKIEIGEKVNFPARPLEGTPLPSGRFWVQLGVRKSLEDAYMFIEYYPANLPPVRLVPYKNKTDGTVFAVIVKNSFGDELTAIDSISQLPPALNTNARVLSKFEEGTIFF